MGAPLGANIGSAEGGGGALGANIGGRIPHFGGQVPNAASARSPRLHSMGAPAPPGPLRGLARLAPGCAPLGNYLGCVVATVARSVLRSTEAQKGDNP